MTTSARVDTKWREEEAVLGASLTGSHVAARACANSSSAAKQPTKHEGRNRQNAARGRNKHLNSQSTTPAQIATENLAVANALSAKAAVCGKVLSTPACALLATVLLCAESAKEAAFGHQTSSE